MAFVELLKVTHGIDNKVTAVDVKVMGVDDKVDGVGREIQEVHDDVQDVGNKVQGVEGRVQAIHGNVQDVSTKVEGVDSRVQGIGSDIKEISNEVQGVDEKLDQVNRSSSLLPLLVIPRPQTASQGDCSEINCYNGFRRQIHPLTITLHTKLITAVQLNGFPREVYSTIGNLLVPSCGYMENVRHTWPMPCDNP